MYIRFNLFAITGLLICLIMPSRVGAAPLIEIANRSGVAGYEIGLFGSGFGDVQGASRLTLGGVAVEVMEWRDKFIKAKIPLVAVQNTQLVLTTSTGTVSWPFTVYSINPVFLRMPQFPLNLSFNHNITQGKYVYYHQSNYTFGIGSSPTRDLSRNRTGGAVELTTNSIIAIDLESPVDAHVWFTFFHSASWYTFGSAPKNYVIEGSGDSTNGLNGTWKTLLNVVDNDRSSRTHYIANPSSSRWFRLRATSVLNGSTFRISEIRVHQVPVNYDATKPINSLTVFGDSNTANDLSLKPDNSFIPTLYYGLTAHALHHNALGLSGSKTTWLNDTEQTDKLSLSEAMRQNPDSYYWGFAFGTNDSYDAYLDCNANNYEDWYSLCVYDQNLADGIKRVMSQGKVPLVARPPITDFDHGGFGSPETLAYILQDTDRINAQFRLIPGPDFYTAFRYNLDFNGGSFISDGTHHTAAGAAVFNQLWAESLAIAQRQAAIPTQEPHTADVNGDGVISVADVQMVIQSYGQFLTGKVDLTGDGSVDIFDLHELIEAFN